MSTPTSGYASQLKNFKQYNKQAREKKALREGFRDAAAYIAYLEACILAESTGDWTKVAGPGIPAPGTSTPPQGTATPPPALPTPPPGTIPTIHVVDVLDASGSMNGEKFDNALKGINEGIKQLQWDKAAVGYTHTLCDFSDDVLFPHVKEDIDNVERIKGRTRGSTALFDAIGFTIEKIQPGINPWDKVLVNIYTDGQENASRKWSSGAVAEKIKELSSLGWTFTFIGTQQDVDYANSKLNVDVSNSMVYDGSAEGLKKSLHATQSARSNYSQKVAAGQDVSKGFYKNVK